MPTPARIAAAAVIGVVVVGGTLLFGLTRAPGPASVEPSDDPSSALQPSPSGSAEPTTRPTPTATPSPLEGSGMVVFEHDTPNLNTRLEYVLPDGRGKELLPDIPGNQETPAWSPDGTRLAFAAWDPQDSASQEQIWETDAAGVTPRLITTDCRPPDCRDEFAPAYSADGGLMAFIRFAGPLGEPPSTTVVAIRDLATGLVTELDSTRTSFADAFVDHPRWSPDGSRLVFSKILIDADENSTDSIVFVVNADGSSLQPLTDPGFEAGDAEWSPDGSRILFARELIHYWFGGGKGYGENTWIYTIAPDRSGLTQLTSDRTGAASWTAAGSQILYSLVNDSGAIGTPDIYVMQADGSNPRAVARYGDCCRWYPVQQPTP